MTKALASNNQVVEGKHIRVDRVGAASSKDPKRSVFLGNVPFDVKDDEVGTHSLGQMGLPPCSLPTPLFLMSPLP